MSFVVSARKYRPQNFDELIGQDHIAQTLKNALKNDKLAHAFLFSGPRGVGKTTSARILAKVLNCQNLQDNYKACGECDSCKAFVDNASFNIFELDAASNNSVEHIRALNEQVRFQPQQGSYKIYIIDEVHMLSQAAFNAFLKTLEEPPPYAKFILATTEKHKIIPTILSRCQIFDFRRIQIKDIVKQLDNIVKTEKRKIDQEALHLIAQKADGAMRDALSIYDKVVSSVEGKITYKEVAENLNVLDYDYYFKLVDAALKEDLTTIMLMFDDIVKKGFETEQFVLGMMEHLRQLLLVKDLKTAAILDISDSLTSRYEKQASLTSDSFLLTSLSILNRTDIDLLRSQNKRLSVEIALSKMAFMNRVVDKKKDSAVVSKPLMSASPTKQTVHKAVIPIKPEQIISKAQKDERKSPKQSASLPEKSKLIGKVDMMGPKVTSDIESLLKSIEKEERDKERDSKQFTIENVVDIIKDYSGTVSSNSVKSALNNIKIELKEDDIKVLSPTQIYLDFIKQELRLIEEIHSAFPNKDIKIIFQVSEETFPDYEPPKKPKHLTTNEKYEMLCTKNKYLKKLIEEFKLKLNNQ